MLWFCPEQGQALSPLPRLGMNYIIQRGLQLDSVEMNNVH